MLICVLVFGMSGCKIKKTVEVRRYHEPTAAVQIVYSKKKLPKGLKRIGTVSVENCGLTYPRLCTFDACLNALSEEACRAGADVIRITYIRRPNRIAYVGLSYLIDGGITRCSATIKANMYVYKDKPSEKY